MESGMMKVVFSSIINGNHENIPANEACAHPKAAVKSFKPQITYSQPSATPEAFVEKSSREVFASLINAANCANVQEDRLMGGYITYTKEGSSLLRKYM